MVIIAAAAAASSSAAADVLESLFVVESKQWLTECQVIPHANPRTRRDYLGVGLLHVGGTMTSQVETRLYF